MDSCVATVRCEGVRAMESRSYGAPGAPPDPTPLATFVDDPLVAKGLDPIAAAAAPLAVVLTLSFPDVRVLSSDPRLLNGGNALTLA